MNDVTSHWARIPIWLPNGEGKSAIVVNPAHVYVVREYRGKCLMLVGVIEYECAVSMERVFQLLNGLSDLDLSQGGIF